MKAWQFRDTGIPLSLDEVAEPSPGPGEVVLDVKAAGLCHSDVGALEDPHWLEVIPSRPIVFGHEIAGVIREIGADVTGFAVGQSVGVCPVSVLGGGPGYTRDGGFTSRHRAPVEDLVAMPDGLSFVHAALGTDAGMTAHHAMVARGGVKAGEKVCVIGLGGLGQIGARVAILRGAELHVAEPNKLVWPLATTIGATSVVADIAEYEGSEFDLVVDYAGFGSTTRGALKAIRIDGRVVLVGMSAMEITLDTMDVIFKQAHVVGSMGGDKSDIAAMYEYLAAGDIDPNITRIKFEQIPQGIDDLKNHRVTGRIVAQIES